MGKAIAWKEKVYDVSEVKTFDVKDGAIHFVHDGVPVVLGYTDIKNVQRLFSEDEENVEVLEEVVKAQIASLLAADQPTTANLYIWFNSVNLSKAPAPVAEEAPVSNCNRDEQEEKTAPEGDKNEK